MPDRRVLAVLGLAALVTAGIGAWWLAGRQAAGGPAAGPAPRYVDETASSGLAHTYDGDLANAVGGGLAVFDCNGDGRPDIYLAGGTNPAELFRNDSPTGGSLKFVPVHDPVTDLAQVNGAYPIDIDGDGITDLVVLRNGAGVNVLRGLGNCRFQDVTAAWGLQPGSAHTEAFSAMWERGSSWPTIAFGNYVNPAITDPSSWCEPDEFVRPNASGTGFGPPLALTPSYCTLSMLFSDWDGSGRMDLRVSNDRDYYRPDVGQEQLWRIEPGQAPRQYTAADGWARIQVQGMGIASYDLTGDGLPEIYLTSEDDSKLQTLAGGASKPTYTNIGLDRGVNVTQPFTGPDIHLGSTAWQPIFDDVNNDGYIDLFVSKGNVKGQLDHAMHDPSNLLLGQPDGTFLEAADTAGIVTFDKGRGAALADFNLDGRLDLVLSKYGAPVQVWRNDGPVSGGTGAPAAHWLALRVTQPGPNTDAIGAVLEVQAGGTTSRREITIGGGHDSGELGWIHIGLGLATSAQVRVHWPDGVTGPWATVAADGFDLLDRSAGLQPWQPPA
ncbi:MAG TPA: CRTAC1 family protein [Candidatus Dormibacteraeota bacterium]|nr:CRTAC1 family protein [Candidatus Dormibacteraeota bacterium]